MRWAEEEQAADYQCPPRERGMDVTINGETTRYYFTRENGINYYKRGIGGMEQPTPLNMSQREFRERAESNGATTRNISASEWRKDLENYKKDRKETNDFLNRNEFNRTAKKDTRAERNYNRGARRRK